MPTPDNPHYADDVTLLATVTDASLTELVVYLRDLLHGGHLTALTSDQVEKLENLLDLVMPGWEDLDDA